MSLELISKVSVSTNVLEVTFNSIPSTFSDLWLQGDLVVGTSGNGPVGIKINSLSSGYDGTIISETPTNSVLHRHAAGDESAQFGKDFDILRSNSASIQAWILNYSSNRRHALLLRGGNGIFGSGQTLAAWRNTSQVVINSLQLVSANGIGAGSTIYLYGVSS